VQTRKILHVDMDAFFASVEQRDFPELKGKPVVVGGNRSHRGVVAAASYEARRYGIHSAMSMARAIRLCPQLHRQSHRMSVYQEESSKIREIFSRFADKVQPLSIDEAFLDVTRQSAQSGITATRLAFQLKQEIHQLTGLTASAGVAPNKFLAKVASDMDKPDGLTVVQPHEVQQFLDPLPVKKIWGIGPATAQKFYRLGISTIGELRCLSLEELVKEFGKAGLHYHQLSRGIDERPVQAGGRAKSLSTESTFSQDVRDPLVLREQIERQSEELARRLERAGLLAATVVLKLRYSDFQTVTRSRTASLHRDRELIQGLALDLLERTEYGQRAVRLLGVGVSGLTEDDGPVQLTLF
jgi:DNA polymerase-4